MAMILRTIRVASLCVVISCGVAGCGGGPSEQVASSPQATATKVPITSTSQKAVDLYRRGRDLADRLKFPEARGLYAEAVAEDESFALAHLGLATTSTNTQGFLDAIERAVQVADSASDGERWSVLAAQAGANGDPTAQKDYLLRLLEAHPGDERVHNQMANWHNGRQELEEAIAHFEKAIEINPDFSAPYNSLGYALRAQGHYGRAEEAFKRYIEMLPEEPNPYDSYAELLMKMGRYQDSIENYQGALAKDPTFIASLVGIANNQMLMGETAAARETLEGLAKIARDDGQRRTAWFWTAASHLHDGDYDKAVEALGKRYEIAEARGGKATLSGDLNLIATVLLHGGEIDVAAAKFTSALEMGEQAAVSEDVKEGTRRNHLYNEARLALARQDSEMAAPKIEEFRQAAAAKQIRFEIRRGHELSGMLALQLQDAETALAELALANQQNPRVLYLQAQACRLAGDAEGMMSFATKAAAFNAINFNYGFVKSSAEKLIEAATSSAS